jgi:hypothetical protein
MLCILGLLIRINLLIQNMKGDRMFHWSVRIPFAVYFGWITVATIANVTTLLVSAQFTGFGISEPVWTAVILVVGVLIGLAWAFKAKEKAYLNPYLGVHRHPDQAYFARRLRLAVHDGYCR